MTGTASGAVLLVPLHGVGSRHDLPLPFGLVVGGAAVVLVLTFVLLLRSWGRARWTEPRGIALPRLTTVVDHPVTRWVARVVVLALNALMLVALFGGQDVVANPFPGYLFVWIWVGLVPVSLLGGTCWRALSPVRTVLAWRGATTITDPLPRLGVWPATLGLLAFGFLELVQPDRATTGVLRWWFLAWLVWTVGGALVAGPRWIASADPFEAYASAVSRMSCWQRIDGTICLVNPLRQLASGHPPRGIWGLAVGLLGVTAFDSLSASSAWVSRVQNLTVNPVLVGATALLVVVAIALGAYLVGARSVARSTVGEPPAGGVVNTLGLSILPITVGYVVAHYTSLFVLEGQRVAINLSDPLTRGDNWFGTAELGVNSALFDHPSVMAWIQALGIIVGHVVGVVVAHDLAVRWLPEPARIRGQLPLLAVMVAFTCCGLLLLFAG